MSNNVHDILDRPSATDPAGSEMFACVQGREVRKMSVRQGSRLPLGQRTVTDADATLAAEDANADINMVSAAAHTVTVPAFATAPFTPGQTVNLFQLGAGQVTVVAAGGVTIHTPETLLLAKQYAVATLKNIALNEWILFGNLEAA